MTSNKQTQGFGSGVCYSCSRQVRLPSWVRKPLNWLKALFSITLETTGSNEIGRLLLGILWSPSLRCCTTAGFFQVLGKVELANERFTSAVKVGNTSGKQSLIPNEGILSYPGALFEGSHNHLSHFLTSYCFKFKQLVTGLMDRG